MFWLSLGNWDTRPDCAQNALNNAGNNLNSDNDIWGTVRGLLDTCITCFANPGDVHKTHFMPYDTRLDMLPFRPPPARMEKYNTRARCRRITNLNVARPPRNNTDTNMTNIHSFADFADVRPGLDGRKRHMEEILNKPIIIRGMRTIASSKNAGEKCLQLQFESDGELCILFTGSAVLIDQCEKYADKIPFQTIVKKIDKYFTFS